MKPNPGQEFLLAYASWCIEQDAQKRAKRQAQIEKTAALGDELNDLTTNWFGKVREQRVEIRAAVNGQSQTS